MANIEPPENAPPRPDPRECRGCGVAVEAIWLPFPAERPGWWESELCIACLDKAEKERQKQRRAEDRRDWLRERVARAGLGEVRREKTFESFEPVPGTSTALGAAKAFAERAAAQPVPRRGLLFVGANGSGKTHLAAAVLNHLLDETDAVSCVFVRFADYLLALRHEFRAPAGENRADDLRRVMAAADVLVLDDLGAAASSRSGWDAEEMVRLLEERDARGLPLIATADVGEGELVEQLGLRVVSRLWGMCQLAEMADGDTIAEDYRRRGGAEA